MVPKYVLTFHEAREPVNAPVTKFGGQPTWYSEPQWPLSRSTGNPMRFIGQVALDARIFGEIQGRMAYLFMTDEDHYIDGTEEPDGGENAVIIQPGICDAPIRPLTNGPTLQKLVTAPVKPKRAWWCGRRAEFILKPCEYTVTLTYDNDPDIIEHNLEPGEEGYAEQDDSKIGGSPAFLQEPAFPAGGPWRFLLQLDGTGDGLFEIKFGEAGIGYAFLSQDGTHGKLLWQSL